MSKYRFDYVAPLAVVITLLLAGPLAWAQNGSTTANYAGYMDHAGCDSLTGWAADLGQPNTSIQVSLLSDGQPIASVAADLLRPDVASAIGDNGMHGFSLPTPATLLDGNTHTIQVMFASSASELPHSPITLACSALPLPPVCADIFI